MGVEDRLHRAADQLNASLAEVEIPAPPHRRRRGWETLAIAAALTIIVVGGAALFVNLRAPVGEESPTTITSSPGFDQPPQAVVVAGTRLEEGLSHIEVGDGSVWVGNWDTGMIWRLDSDTLEVLASAKVGVQGDLLEMKVSGDVVYIVHFRDQQVKAFDGETLLELWAADVPISRGGLSVSEDGVWVANDAPGQFTRLAGQLVRLDRDNGAVVATIPIDSPIDIDVVGDDVWVLTVWPGNLSMIDGDTNEVVRVIPIPGSPSALAIGADYAWVATDARIGPRTWRVLHFDLTQGTSTGVELPSDEGLLDLVSASTQWALVGERRTGQLMFADSKRVEQLEGATLGQRDGEPMYLDAVAAPASLWRWLGDSASLALADNTLWIATPSGRVQRIELVASGQPTPTTLPDESILPGLENLGDNLVFLSTDTHLTVIDVDAAGVSRHEIPQLAPGDPQYRLARRGDTLVFYGGNQTFAIDPRQSMTPSLLSESWFFIPSSDEERVWVATLDPDSPETVRALSAVAELTIEGTITSGPVRPPGGRWPVAAIDDGLLFQGESTLDLWDPETESFLAQLPGPFPVATWRNRVVTCVECDELYLIDRDADTQRTVLPPDGVAGFDGYEGAFSPDGRYVAVVAFDSLGPWEDDPEGGVVLVDFEAGTSMVIPGTSMSGLNYPMVGWGGDGRLYFYTSDQLLSYRPGDNEAQRIPVSLSGPYYGMATG